MRVVLIDEQDLREDLADRGGVDEGEEGGVVFREVFDGVDAVVELEDGTGRFVEDAPGLLVEGIVEVTGSKGMRPAVSSRSSETMMSSATATMRWSLAPLSTSLTRK